MAGGRYINVQGTVLAITYPPYGARPEVLVNVQVGGTLLSLVFQSRISLDALAVGQPVRVKGNVVIVDGAPTIYNPEYEILGRAHV